MTADFRLWPLSDMPVVLAMSVLGGVTEVT